MTVHCVHVVKAPSLPESAVHFFLHCQLYIDLRRVLLDSVSEIILNDVRVYPDQHMCQITSLW